MTGDPRIGDLLGRAPGEPRAVLIGFPSDEGVRRNGGRTGAADGPRALRQALSRLTPDADRTDAFVALIEQTRDLGDVPVTGDVEADQELLATIVAPQLQAGRFVIVLGGGHETSFGHFLGHAALGRAVHVLNWDAHADVREPREGRAHSGSPFRQAVLHPSGLCASYNVAGLQPHSVATPHLAFVRTHGRAVFRHDVGVESLPAIYGMLSGRSFVSFDIDAVDQAYAPGVSAPATNGLPVAVWLEAAFLAGRDERVLSADIVELCPAHDRDGQTARLAALTVWQLLRGIAARPEHIATHIEPEAP
ncbi:MAG: formimidoylglutamase [Gemmatimonadota bacterium]